jgi:hypothetical protein
MSVLVLGATLTRGVAGLFQLRPSPLARAVVHGVAVEVCAATQDVF